jgi:hypothetical protein
VEGNPKEHKGYTTNVSLTGMFVASTHLPAKGAKVTVEYVDHGQPVRLEGLAVRVKQVPIELRRVQPAGFGVRFTQNARGVRPLMPDEESTSPDSGAVTCAKVTFDSAARFLDVFRREIRTGSMILVMPGAAAVGTPLLIDLIPPASLGGPVRCAARINQVMRGSVLVQFDDLPEVLADLKGHVEKAMGG